MDKQINTLSNIINTKIQESGQDLNSSMKFAPADRILPSPSAILPVNTRTIGVPEGIYILYLEDYVHTFMKKVLSDKKTQSMAQGDILESVQPEVALYGKYIEENGRYRIVVSGAALLQENDSKVKQYSDTYFPSCTYIGSAYICFNKDSRLRLELTLRSTKVILDDFYIYYDQNEEMQNYLVEWNKNPVSPTEHETYIRKNIDDAARLGRIAQAYNREEAKVSFMWNVMNVLCLGFVVCVMVYGIISVNNYNKMQGMQANIDYCMAFIAENTTFDLSKLKPDDNNAIVTIQQNMQSENEKAQTSAETQEDIQKAQESEGISEHQIVTETTAETNAGEVQPLPTGQQNEQENSQPPEDTAQVPADTNQPQENTPQDVTQTNQPSEEGQAAIPQYYVVRRGDTLRTICFDIYGDYSRVDEICKWNNIEDPDNILYGQKLLLPSK